MKSILEWGKPVLVDSWNWNHQEMTRRLGKYQFTDTARAVYKRLGDDIVGADQALRVSGLRQIIGENKVPLLGLVVTHPKPRFGKLGRYVLENIGNHKPLVDVVRVDLNSEDIALAEFTKTLPFRRFPNDDPIVMTINQFGEFAPDELYIMQPVIVRVEEVGIKQITA